MQNKIDNAGATTYVQKCQVNFDDLDAFGMLYHGRYYALIDRGFFACVTGLGFSPGHDDLNLVVRQMDLTFGTPIRRFGEVELVLWPRSISRSSATFGFVVKSDDGDHAWGIRSITKFDPATGRSKPWSAEIRATFGADDTGMDIDGVAAQPTRDTCPAQ